MRTAFVQKMSFHGASAKSLKSDTSRGNLKQKLSPSTGHLLCVTDVDCFQTQRQSNNHPTTTTNPHLTNTMSPLNPQYVAGGRLSVRDLESR